MPAMAGFKFVFNIMMYLTHLILNKNGPDFANGISNTFMWQKNTQFSLNFHWILLHVD